MLDPKVTIGPECEHETFQVVVSRRSRWFFPWTDEEYVAEAGEAITFRKDETCECFGKLPGGVSASEEESDAVDGPLPDAQ